MENDRDLAWKAAAELFAAERHFNQMQNHCRTLASTWLLAAFAGIGFLYKERPFSDNALAAALIAIAAAGGIFLLWMLDVKVWHRLLLANSIAGYRIEQENSSWMPKVRQYIAETRGLFPVRVHLSLFYSLGILALDVIGAVFTTRSTSLRAPWLVASVLLVVGIGVSASMVRSAFSSHARDSGIMKDIDNKPLGR